MSLPCIGGKKTQAYKIKEKKRRNKKKRISIASIRICQVRMLLFINTNGIQGIQLLSVHISHTLIALIDSCDLLFCCMTELDVSK